jgi:hypothetical protein
MMKRLKSKQRQHVVVVREAKMEINLKLSVEEINVLLGALNVGLVDKIKTQAMAQIAAQQAPVVEPAAE